MQIWDGTTPSRKDMETVRQPDHQDWRAAVQQIQQIQEFCINTIGNLELLPNFENALADAKEQLDEFLDAAESVTPPADLAIKIAEIVDKLAEIDQRDEITELRRIVAACQTKHAEAMNLMTKLSVTVEQELKKLTNLVHNRLQDHAAATDAKIKALEEAMSKMHDATTLANLIERIKA